MKTLGLDVGDKNIGIALGEDILATEYDTLRGLSWQEAISEILDICQREEVGKIIIGMPKNMNDNSEGIQAKKVRQFYQNLIKATKIPIFLEDETLTSVQAEEMLKDEGLNPQQAKERIDQLSAKLILQQYLESNES